MNRYPAATFLATSVLLVLPFCVVADSTPITALQFSKSAAILVAGSDEGLFLYDPVTLKRQRKIQIDFEKVLAIQFSDDESMCAVVGGSPSEFGAVIVFRTSNWNPVYREFVFEDVVTDCVWTINGQLIACSMTGECCRINPNVQENESQPFLVHTKGIQSIERLSRNTFATASNDQTIRIWDFAKNEPDKARAIRSFNNHTSKVIDLALRPTLDSKTAPMLASASSDSTIRFWQPSIGRMVRFVRLDSIPTCICWTNDGTTIVAGCQNGTLKFIDPKRAKVIKSIEAQAGWINQIDTTETSIFVGGVSGLKIVDH